MNSVHDAVRRVATMSLHRLSIIAQAVTLACSSAGQSAAQSATCFLAVQSIDWRTSPLDLNLRGMNGERYVFDCPPGRVSEALVIGSGPYADASSICAAAVHAGAIRAGVGGIVEVEIRPGQRHYRGSTRHFVHATPYDQAWGGSFVIQERHRRRSVKPAGRLQSPPQVIHSN